MARDEHDGGRGGGAAAGQGPTRLANASGLEQVYFEHRAVLLRFLRARGAGDDAEDLLQELWLKAAGGASGPIRDPLPYLYRVANNLMLDRRRAELRRARRDHEWSGADEGMTAVSSEAPSDEQAALARDELRTVAQALSDLGERTDLVFRRFRLDGFTQKQIAEEQGISLSAVEKHLQKAYRLLVALRRRLDAD